MILYPNSAVIGQSLVKRGSVIAQGVSVINKNTEENKIVFQGEAGKLIFKSSEKKVLADYFRDV